SSTGLDGAVDSADKLARALRGAQEFSRDASPPTALSDTRPTRCRALRWPTLHDTLTEVRASACSQRARGAWRPGAAIPAAFERIMSRVGRSVVRASYSVRLPTTAVETKVLVRSFTSERDRPPEALG